MRWRTCLDFAKRPKCSTVLPGFTSAHASKGYERVRRSLQPLRPREEGDLERGETDETNSVGLVLSGI